MRILEPRYLRICVVFVAVLFLPSRASCVHAQNQPPVEFERTLPLPNIKIDGEKAHIHTQGLYLDDQFIYVTGRLERKPKKALFLRFDRKSPSRYAVMNLSNLNAILKSDQLDHPGGFDFDGIHFWIPVARSNPRGPSVIVKVKHSPGTPFSNWPHEIGFKVDDHIGALAMLRPSKQLVGANWDTQKIYFWNRKGELQRSVSRHQWLTNDPTWSLAVQDWKAARPSNANMIIASGIDKSKDRDEPRAFVDLIDAHNGKILDRRAIPSVPGFRRRAHQRRDVFL